GSCIRPARRPPGRSASPITASSITCRTGGTLGLSSPAAGRSTSGTARAARRHGAAASATCTGPPQAGGASASMPRRRCSARCGEETATALPRPPVRSAAPPGLAPPPPPAAVSDPPAVPPPRPDVAKARRLAGRGRHAATLYYCKNGAFGGIGQLHVAVLIRR